MIASSVPDGEQVVSILLQRDADVNAKSTYSKLGGFDSFRDVVLTQTSTRRQHRPGKLAAEDHHPAPDRRVNTAKTRIRQTAMHFVASKKHLDIARLLVDHKASTRTRDRRGQYPIHRAAAVGSVPMVSLLLKNRSPLNAADTEGYTPLHHAVAEGHGMSTIYNVRVQSRGINHVSCLGDTAVALLKEGADYTLKNSAEELAMDLAPDRDVRCHEI